MANDMISLSPAPATLPKKRIGFNMYSHEAQGQNPKESAENDGAAISDASKFMDQMMAQMEDDGGDIRSPCYSPQTGNTPAKWKELDRKDGASIQQKLAF